VSRCGRGAHTRMLVTLIPKKYVCGHASAPVCASLTQMHTEKEHGTGRKKKQDKSKQAKKKAYKQAEKQKKDSKQARKQEIEQESKKE
jgi:hypothetical protein